MNFPESLEIDPKRKTDTKDMDNNVQESPKRSRKRGLFMDFLSWLAMVIVLSFIAGFGMDYFKRSDSGGFVEKDSFKSSLVRAIKNGGDLDLLKHMYARRKAENPILFFGEEREKYYPYETAFSLILEDLRSDYFSADKFECDSLYQWRLDSIIKENTNRDPFDQLEGAQQYYFNNVITKSAENYFAIQEDVNYIANELQEKNLLVSRYLSKSTVSFVISILALALTLIASIWQICLAYKGLRLKEQEEITEEDGEEDESCAQ